MNFSEFLQDRKAQKNIASSKAHYLDLGGKPELGISLRHFQQIETGRYPPSEKLLLAVFNSTGRGDRHTLINSYFASVFSKTATAAELLNYLSQHVSPAIEHSSRNVWDTPVPLMFYSEEQMDYLLNNPDAMRFHHRVLLYEQVSLREAGLFPSKMEDLENLGLIRVEGGEAVAGRTLFRIPTYQNSGPRLAAKGAQFIRKHVENYASDEGSSNQVMAAAMHRVTPAVAKRILTQVETLKKWIQSTAVDEPQQSGTEIPLVFVGFAKALEERELLQ